MKGDLTASKLVLWNQLKRPIYSTNMEDIYLFIRKYVPYKTIVVYHKNKSIGLLLL